MSIAGLASWIRHWRKTQSGVAAIEFALLSPLLALLLIGLVEVGLASFEAMQVQDAAEAGALYAARHGWDSAGIQSAVLNATGASGITVSPAPTTYCGCPQTTGISVISCASTCTGGITPSHYVEVHASLTHQQILAYPGLPSPLVLQGKATVRLN